MGQARLRKQQRQQLAVESTDAPRSPRGISGIVTAQPQAVTTSMPEPLAAEIVEVRRDLKRVGIVALFVALILSGITIWNAQSGIAATAGTTIRQTIGL